MITLWLLTLIITPKNKVYPGTRYETLEIFIYVDANHVNSTDLFHSATLDDDIVQTHTFHHLYK